MANKYLKGGALNPIWCDEEDARILAENTTSMMESLYEICSMMAEDDIDVDFNLELAEGLNVNVSSANKENPKDMCSIIDTESELEAKFNFLKRHSSTPEDLELAKEIIGLK